jgi:hypothetical protein
MHDRKCWRESTRVHTPLVYGPCALRELGFGYAARAYSLINPCNTFLRRTPALRPDQRPAPQALYLLRKASVQVAGR